MYFILALLPSVFLLYSHSVEAANAMGTDDNDTTNIVVWFLAVSAVCALFALILIMCWKRCSKAQSEIDRENRNSINLEFLLDPNGSLDTAMHIDDRRLSGSNLERVEEESEEDEEFMEEVKPIKSAKRTNAVRKTSLLGRLSESGGGDDGNALLDNLMGGDRAPYDEEYVQVTDDDEELGGQDINPLMDDYNPPNMQRL